MQTINQFIYCYNLWKTKYCKLYLRNTF